MNMPAARIEISDHQPLPRGLSEAVPGHRQPRSQRPFLAMLLLALLLHLLLVWQLNWPSAPAPLDEGEVLQVQLQASEPAKPVTPPAPPEPLETPTPATVETAVAEAAPELPDEVLEPAPPEPETVAVSRWESLNAPMLREQAKELLRERPGEALARPQVQPLARLRPALPRTLTKARALPLIPTPFSDIYLTGETEIIDEWETPEGGREVILRAPNGQVLCGRRAPRELLEPLVEPIMLFRAC